MQPIKISPLIPCRTCVGASGITVHGGDCRTCGATGQIPRPRCTCIDGKVTTSYVLRRNGPLIHRMIEHTACLGTGFILAADDAPDPGVWLRFMQALRLGGWHWSFDVPNYLIEPLVLCYATRGRHRLITTWHATPPHRVLSAARYDETYIDAQILKEIMR